MRMSVVLPAPFGATSPTRSPWNNSNPRSSKSGPASNPRDSPEQLSSNMLPEYGPPAGRGRRTAGQSAGQEAVDHLGPGDAIAQRAEHGTGVVALAVEPADIGPQERQGGVGRVGGRGFVELPAVVGEAVRVRAVQVAEGGAGLRPVRLPGHAAVDGGDRLGVLA